MGLQLLINLLSFDFVLHHEAFRFLRSSILMLRSVNSQLKRALHEDANVSLNIRVSQPIFCQLNQDFLFTWKGTLLIHIKNVKADCHPWLQSLAAALASKKSKPRIGILDLEVAGQNLPNLVGLLAEALAAQRAVQSVALRYEGSCRPIAAARLAALQAAVPTEVIASFLEDSLTEGVVDGLIALRDSGVAVRTLELR